MVISIDSLGGGGADPERDFFTPTLSQTVFNLSGTPVDPTDTIFKVNNVPYPEGGAEGYFTVSGTVATWLNTFVLDTNDRVEIIYFV